MMLKKSQKSCLKNFYRHLSKQFYEFFQIDCFHISFQLTGKLCVYYY